jgi:hypothetical protein
MRFSQSFNQFCKVENFLITVINAFESLSNAKKFKVTQQISYKNLKGLIIGLFLATKIMFYIMKLDTV